MFAVTPPSDSTSPSVEEKPEPPKPQPREIRIAPVVSVIEDNQQQNGQESLDDTHEGEEVREKERNGIENR